LDGPFVFAPIERRKPLPSPMLGRRNALAMALPSVLISVLYAFWAFAVGSYFRHWEKGIEGGFLYRYEMGV